MAMENSESGSTPAVTFSIDCVSSAITAYDPYKLHSKKNHMFLLNRLILFSVALDTDGNEARALRT